MAGQPQDGPAGLRSEPRVLFADIVRVPNHPQMRRIRLPSGDVYLELVRRIDPNGKAMIWTARVCDLTGYGSFAARTGDATHVVKLESKRVRRLDDPLIHVLVATHLQRECVNKFGHPELLVMPVQSDEEVGSVMPLYDASLFAYCSAAHIPPASLPPLSLQRLLVDWVLHLHLLHREGLVHSDVSPDNMMVALNGQRGLLIDFGTTAEEVGASGLGMQERFFGKPGYRAPEAFDPHVAQATHATDIWCLGASILHFLSKQTLGIGGPSWCTHQVKRSPDFAWPVAQRAHAGDPAAFGQRMQALVDAEVTHRCAASRQPQAAAAFVRRCLRVDPAQRPTARELLADPYISGVVQHAGEGAALSTEEGPRVVARHDRLRAIAAMAQAAVPQYPAQWVGQPYRPPPRPVAAASGTGGLRIALPPRPPSLGSGTATGTAEAGTVAGAGATPAAEAAAAAPAAEAAAATAAPAPIRAAGIAHDPHEDDSESDDEDMDDFDDVL